VCYGFDNDLFALSPCGATILGYTIVHHLNQRRLLCPMSWLLYSSSLDCPVDKSSLHLSFFHNWFFLPPHWSYFLNWSATVESYITTDGQSASLSWNKAPIWGLRPHFYYCQTVVSVLMWGVLSDQRTGLPFTIAAGPRQRSHFRVRDPWDSWAYFTVSDSRLPFRRLLRLGGLRWRYSTPPPRGSLSSSGLIGLLPITLLR
jgi:hypothetical protein